MILKFVNENQMSKINTSLCVRGIFLLKYFGVKALCPRGDTFQEEFVIFKFSLELELSLWPG